MRVGRSLVTQLESGDSYALVLTLLLASVFLAVVARVYFSFVTISTTGFGDLGPASGVGRAFAVMEIIIGQLYLVTVVAILVTAATRRRLTAHSRVGSFEYASPVSDRLTKRRTTHAAG